MAITPDQILFFAGGRSLELYGTPYRRTRPKTRGGEEVAQTFTRSSTGSYIDRDGEIKLAESGLQRINMVDLGTDGIRETPTFLLEDTRTNGFTRSEELDNAAWTKIRATVSANATTAPDGKTTADKLVEDGTASNTHVFRRNTPTLTDDTQQPWSVFAKAAGRSEIRLTLLQKDGTSAMVWFDLSAGTVGTETDAVGLIDPLGDDWYRCMITADSANGGTTPLAQVNLGSGSETESYNGDSSSGVYFWGMQFEVDKAFPSSYIATAGSTVARAQEVLNFPFGAQPQAMTVYLRFVEDGSIKGGPYLLSISNSVDATPSLLCFVASSVYKFRHNNGTSTVTVGAAAAPSIGDTVEFVGQIDANGAVKLIQSINGTAAETATSANLALAAAWSGPTIYINDRPQADVTGFNDFVDIAMFAGVHSRADCQKALQQ